MPVPMPLIYECHITVDPIEGEKLELFNKVCAIWEFKVAKLVMVKDRQITEDRGNKDQFCTGHNVDFEVLDTRAKVLMANLRVTGFRVRRFKIEAILTDERY